jgi:hypothetical protein
MQGALPLLLTIVSDSRKAEPVLAALRRPGDIAPPRNDRSIRRTSHIDILVPGRATSDVSSGCTYWGTARDLITQHGSSRIVGVATIDAVADASGRLTALTLEPAPAGTADLVGRSTGRGFRDAVRSACPDDVEQATPLGLLLDDLPVAALISGYARLAEGNVPADAAQSAAKSDVCAGWRSDGTMMTSVRAGRGVPVTIGPALGRPGDEAAADPQGWHRMPQLAPRGMRRRRLVDVTVRDAVWDVFAMFQDTHASADGRATILHEYSLSAGIDPTTAAITACHAVPHVLPWDECPSAAASADRLIGTRLDHVRADVRSTFRGTSTCTHLNDLLRSLGDIPALVRHFSTEEHR